MWLLTHVLTSIWFRYTAVELSTLMNNFIPLIYVDIITYPYRNCWLGLSFSVKEIAGRNQLLLDLWNNWFTELFNVMDVHPNRFCEQRRCSQCYWLIDNWARRRKTWLFPEWRSLTAKVGENHRLLFSYILVQFNIWNFTIVQTKVQHDTNA